MSVQSNSDKMCTYPTSAGGSGGQNGCDQCAEDSDFKGDDEYDKKQVMRAEGRCLRDCVLLVLRSESS